MRRIAEMLDQESKCSYPYDVAILKRSISELRLLSNSQVEELYTKFSDMWGAGWLMVDEERLEQFAEYLRT